MKIGKNNHNALNNFLKIILNIKTSCETCQYNNGQTNHFVNGEVKKPKNSGLKNFDPNVKQLMTRLI